jgi:hypothetical protein
MTPGHAAGWLTETDGTEVRQKATAYTGVLGMIPLGHADTTRTLTVAFDLLSQHMQPRAVTADRGRRAKSRSAGSDAYNGKATLRLCADYRQGASSPLVSDNVKDLWVVGHRIFRVSSTLVCRSGKIRRSVRPGTWQGRKFRSSYVADAGGWVSEAMHAVSRRRIWSCSLASRLASMSCSTQ